MKNIIFVISLLIVFSLNAHAWSVSKVKGEAMISRAGQLIPAEEGFSLVASDVVQTMKNSRILIQEGSNKIWLGAKTKFKVGNINKNRGAKKSTQTLNLIYGKIRSTIKKKSDSRVQLKFKTPTAVAGVRGTEFFIESTESGEFFCTLEGSIEVETKEGDDFVIDEGKGLRLALGEVPNLSGTSSLLVDRWVAETSFEEQDFVPEDLYGFKKFNHKLGKTDFRFGMFGSAYYCGSKNTDFDDAISDKSMDCYRYYYSPFINIGIENKIFLRPAILGTHTEQPTVIDPVPWKVGKDETAVTIAEAYYETQKFDWLFRLGLQDVHWADGVLLSTRSASIEPQSHLAFRAFGKIADWEVEFLGGPGQKDDDPLMGHTHIKTVGLKGKMPKERGELYVLHANFDELGSNPPVYAHMYYGHEILNIGYYGTRKRDDWDYAVSYIYQDHSTHHDTSNVRGEAQADMADLTIGRQLGQARPMRFSLRWLKASRNFVPVLEDYYTLSNSTIFAQRTNIEQYRAKLELQITESQNVFGEYIMSSQPSSSTAFASYGTAEKGDDLAAELAISHKWKISHRWAWSNTLWQIDPDSSLGTDAATGLNSRLSFHY